MFIKEKDGGTVAELDRVEIALLFCLLRNMKPKEAIEATEDFLKAQDGK